MKIDGYEQPRPVNAGAMGEVYYSRHKQTGIEVAIKRIPKAPDPQLDAFRQQELRATASLQHQNLIRCLDAGELDDGGTWLALDWCPNGTLRDVCDWPTLLDALNAVLQALGHAHARSILHKDIKAANGQLVGCHHPKPLAKRLMDDRYQRFDA